MRNRLKYGRESILRSIRIFTPKYPYSRHGDRAPSMRRARCRARLCRVFPAMHGRQSGKIRTDARMQMPIRQTSALQMADAMPTAVCGA
ncbi:hypothetical protein OH687_05290 [Burkholderia anthina]|nr:hypothetical protein OH687_05290 [Burkholderia anthina]